METQNTKICSRCGKELPLTEFYFTNGKPRSYCKKCVMEYNAERKEKIKTEAKEKKEGLKRYTPRELIDEFITRGYRGKIYYMQEIKLEK